MPQNTQVMSLDRVMRDFDSLTGNFSEIKSHSFANLSVYPLYLALRHSAPW